MAAFFTFVLLAAGNCKLWTEFVNRIHARPWPRRTLKRIRRLHEFGMIAGCAAALPIAWRLASRPTEVGWGEGALILAWLLGLARLTSDAARHLLSRMPNGITHDSSQIVDVAAELGEVPTGDGEKSFLAAVPLNQSFQIEVTHKTFAHPAYPSAEPIRVLHLTDWHFSGTPDKRFYERATELCLDLEYDLAVFTGDLVDRLSLLEWLPDTLGRIDAPLGRYFILGNHDWSIGMDEARSAMVDIGWNDLADQRATISHAGGAFLLTGDERPWNGNGPPLESPKRQRGLSRASVSEDQQVVSPRSSLAEASGSSQPFEISLVHTPDRIVEAYERGAEVVLAGHNHGGQVVLPVLGPVYAPSRYGVRYAGGCYRKGDTLMHVGRGLGGIDPLRINCRPEITVVTLAAGNSPPRSRRNSLA